MTAAELDQFIEGQMESQTLDFKGDCPWKAVAFAKDILAMANVKDGGRIIIGVAEAEKFEPVGMSPANAATYKVDVMKDQMRKFADPYVDFSVSHITRIDGKVFVAIRVFPFLETPVLCRRDHPEGLIAGTLYYRNTDRRPESAPVSNAYDMRAIIERAAVQVMRYRKDLGYTISSSDDDLLNKELEGL